MNTRSYPTPTTPDERHPLLRVMDHKLPPPIVAGLVALLMWAATAIGPFLSAPPLVFEMTALALMIVGCLFDLLGVIAFLWARTTINPIDLTRASALVTTGIYRLSRNPMYVGLVVLLTAWAFYLKALLPFLGPLLFVLYIRRFQIEAEEQALSACFGDEYAAYAARVRRWI